MKKSLPELIELGEITRAHGVHGELVIITDKPMGDELTQAAFLFIELQNKPVPFPVENIRWQSSTALIVKFDFIENESQARSFKGFKIWMEKITGTPEVDDTFQQYIGYILLNEEGLETGTVVSVMEIPGNPLLVASMEGKETLIPFEANYILNIQKETKTIRVKLPEGLADL